MKTKHLFSMITLFALVIGFINSSCYNKKNEPQQQQQEQQPIAQTQVQESVTPFDYTPPAPVDGKLKGVVELGASGFNLFIIKLDKDKNWKKEKYEFGNSLIKEGMTSAEDVRTTLKDYIQTIVSHGVASRDVHFVVSSGAAKEDITQTITKALKSLGYVVNIVTPDQEAKYAFRATMPQTLEDEAYVVDLGSGNTKISYMQDGKLVGKETYGSKYFQKEVDNNTVADDVKKIMGELPAARAKTCFLIGGVPYQMAKKLRQGEERYTVLKTQLTAYDELVAEKGQQASCGLNIYESILSTTDTKQMIFDWDANFTIGFLLTMPY